MRAVDPEKYSSKIGDIMIPIKLPKIELNTAAGSFPPIAFVIMTAEDTGGGMQLTVSKPCNIQVFIPLKRNRRMVVNARTMTGMHIKVKHWIKA